MASGRVFVSLDDGTTRALDPATGATLWTQPGAGGSIAYDRDRVFAVNTQRLAALDAATGAIVWQVPSGREGWPALVTASDGELYVNYLGWIVRHDPATGARTWSYGTHNTGNRAVTLEGSRVWVGGACAPLDRATGQPTREDNYDLCADSTFAVAPFSQGHLIENNGFYAMYDIDTAARDPLRVHLIRGAAGDPRQRRGHRRRRLPQRLGVPELDAALAIPRHGIPGRDTFRRATADRRPDALLPQPRHTASLRRRDRRPAPAGLRVRLSGELRRHRDVNGRRRRPAARPGRDRSHRLRIGLTRGEPHLVVTPRREGGNGPVSAVSSVPQELRA